MAHAILAILLARAIAATLVGLRANKAASQSRCLQFHFTNGDILGVGLPHAAVSASGFNEREQVGVDRFRLRGRHASRSIAEWSRGQRYSGAGGQT
jgi:hypothetical protein